MNKRTWFRSTRTGLASALVLMSFVVPGEHLIAAPAAPESKIEVRPMNPGLLKRPLVGTWRMQITLRICESGAALRPPFPAMATYAAGGTVTTSDSAFNPALRGAGHGVWSFRAGGYDALVEAFLYDSSGAMTGTQRLRQAIELSNDGNSLSATVAAEVLDIHGNVLMRGCASAVGQRMD